MERLGIAIAALFLCACGINTAKEVVINSDSASFCDLYPGIIRRYDGNGGSCPDHVSDKLDNLNEYFECYCLKKGDCNEKTEM